MIFRVYKRERARAHTHTHTHTHTYGRTHALTSVMMMSEEEASNHFLMGIPMVEGNHGLNRTSSSAVNGPWAESNQLQRGKRPLGTLPALLIYSKKGLVLFFVFVKSCKDDLSDSHVCSACCSLCLVQHRLKWRRKKTTKSKRTFGLFPQDCWLVFTGGICDFCCILYLFKRGNGRT